MLGKKNFKMVSFLLTFLYTFSILSLSFVYGVGLCTKNNTALRIPSLFKENRKVEKADFIRMMENRDIVPVASPKRWDNKKLDEGDFKRNITRMANAGIRWFFVGTSSGDLTNLMPEDVAAQVRWTREALESLGIKKGDYHIVSGARGRNKYRVMEYIELCVAEGSEGIVITHQDYEVPNDEAKHTVYGLPSATFREHLSGILEEMDKDDSIPEDIRVIIYDISLKCGGKHISVEDGKYFRTHKRVVAIKVSTEDVRWLKDYAELQIPCVFIAELGFVNCLNALTGGIVKDAAGNEVEIDKEHSLKAVIPISTNAIPFAFSEFEKRLKERDADAEKILAFQQILADEIHPRWYGNEDGKGYPNLVRGINLVLELLGVFRNCEIEKTILEGGKEEDKDFLKRVRADLMTREIILTEHKVDVDEKMDRGSFYTNISDFFEETTDWVANHLPLLGKMTNEEKDGLVRYLDGFTVTAHRDILSSKNKKGRVSTSIVIDKGCIILKVDYTGGVEPSSEIYVDKDILESIKRVYDPNSPEKGVLLEIVIRKQPIDTVKDALRTVGSFKERMLTVRQSAIGV